MPKYSTYQKQDTYCTWTNQNYFWKLSVNFYRNTVNTFVKSSRMHAYRLCVGVRSSHSAYTLVIDALGQFADKNFTTDRLQHEFSRSRTPRSRTLAAPAPSRQREASHGRRGSGRPATHRLHVQRGALARRVSQTILRPVSSCAGLLRKRERLQERRCQGQSGGNVC